MLSYYSLFKLSSGVSVLKIETTGIIDVIYAHSLYLLSFLFFSNFKFQISNFLPQSTRDLGAARGHPNSIIEIHGLQIGGNVSRAGGPEEVSDHI
jgi:hypothetical protein